MQNIINRFTVQSFAIKGFSFAFLGLIYETYYNNFDFLLFTALCFGICVFWYLDSFYLKMEKIYRIIESETNKFNEHTKISYNYKDEIYKNLCFPYICEVMFSKTIFPLYLVQFLLLIVPLVNFLKEYII